MAQQSYGCGGERIHVISLAAGYGHAPADAAPRECRTPGRSETVKQSLHLRSRTRSVRHEPKREFGSETPVDFARGQGGGGVRPGGDRVQSAIARSETDSFGRGRKKVAQRSPLAGRTGRGVSKLGCGPLAGCQVDRFVRFVVERRDRGAPDDPQRLLNSAQWRNVSR